MGKSATKTSTPSNVFTLPGSSSPPAPASNIPAAELGTPPAWLSRQARDLWRELVPKLEDAFPDAITVLDAPALALMLEHLAIVHSAAKGMRGRGGWIETTTVDEAHRDRLRKAPSSQVMRDHAKAFLELAREYGMTPKSRRLLDLVPIAADDVDEDDDLFDT